MAEFETKIVKIDSIIDHPNADRLTIVSIGGFKCIANKKDNGDWRYKQGDLVVYVQEGSIVPEYLLKRLDMWDEEKQIGFLAGKKGNRVKAIRLRKILSQGILIPVINNQYIELNDAFDWIDKDRWEERYSHCVTAHFGNNPAFGVKEGDDVSEILNITKYDPPIPESMSGEVIPCFNLAFKYDVENYQKYPNCLIDDEEVIFTEKLHGTFMGMGFIPGLGLEGSACDGDAIVFSKGLGHKGLFFKSDDKNIGNIYVKMLHKLIEQNNIYEIIKEMRLSPKDITPVYIFGELFGAGIQDLDYGHIDGAKSFRGFDVYIGFPGLGKFLNFDDKTKFFNKLGIDQVPILYRGPWSIEQAEKFCKGTDTISNSHIREGVVINTATERSDDILSRIQLKYINPKYLLRKGGTELN